MGKNRPADRQSEDRLPVDWKQCKCRYDSVKSARYEDVLKKLSEVGSMSREECERAAFVIVERDGLARDDHSDDD